MQLMRRIRRRDGAIRWGLFEDAATPGRYIETFVVESWAEHLRQHERVTISDRETEVAGLRLSSRRRPAQSHPLDCTANELTRTATEPDSRLRSACATPWR